MKPREFWSRVRMAQPDECWEWVGPLFPGGYGRVNYNGTRQGAHRVAYELTHGPIPPGMDILHSCDLRKCCNPKHLKVGTDQDNVRDKVSRESIS